MRKNTQKGFTLIELLVVIAIIAILATIVLTNLGGATKKAADTKIQGQLSSMRAQAQLYTATGTYAATTAVTPCVVGSAGTSLFESASNGLGGLLPSPATSSECASDATLPSAGGKWAAAFVLSTGKFACVDYTGASMISSQASALLAIGGATGYTCTP
jgi:prepilin-type N-terminal cleavage/methylation domain-containing protein